MPWHKRLLKAQATQAATSRLLAMYIKFVFLSGRIDRHIDPAALPYMQGEKNGIFAFWHGRMMMMLAFKPPKRDMYVLSTPHRDGQLSSRVVRLFGSRTIYGSSSQGGHSAAREMIRALETGGNICITPEGPRGPLQVAQKGILAVARLSGRPVLPVAFASTRQKMFDSWDKFVLPLPFGRIAFCVGAPLMIARDAAEEPARQAVERALNEQLEKADRLSRA